MTDTTPRTLADNVDPGLKEMTVTFDGRMNGTSWSWTQFNAASFPKVTGAIRYDTARRTCTMPVKLEPGKVYWVGINHARFTGFRSATGTPARHHIILFATRGKDGKATKIPANLIAQAKAINARSAKAPS